VLANKFMPSAQETTIWLFYWLHSKICGGIITNLDGIGAQLSHAQQETIVLVHGAFHGGWCWEELTPFLEGQGARCEVIELPLTSLADDIREVRSALDQLSAQVTLVGHSYGGSVITGAGDHDAVKALVFVTALALTPDETSVDHEFAAISMEQTEATFAAMNVDGDRISVKPGHAVEHFYHDLEPEVIAKAVARLRPMSPECFSASPGVASWLDRTSTYVVCTDDHAIPVHVQRLMAARIGARTEEMATSHSPFYRDPATLAMTIVGAAAQPRH
jgi:pimeloyl-ACP methyl ester carboxylesterase